MEIRKLVPSGIEMVLMGRFTTTEEVLAEMGRSGLRPLSTEEELLSVQHVVRPDLRLVALGCRKMLEGSSCAGILYYEDLYPIPGTLVRLNYEECDQDWHPLTGFLAVRE